ncbi:fibroblast growth factor-binding protein 2-like [Myxocyprinus asiaticus]|uniref:fibroblast growth factor-binding protein 2-like n=1 Tax=Myxocyprinus asiaticus TaxID=70543 RepID=UPI002223CB0C|nr:fibroblast growth factor-binding protein 2-like [Myxocyprinus asiaticus]
MRAICSVALLLGCFIWAINAQAQSSQSNSNQGNTNQGNSINHIDSTHNSRQQNQPQPKGSIWDEPIRFNTKAKDACSMVISGHSNFTKLRISCKSKGKSYWCDFLGKPNLCRAYNNNPRHYFTQIMWDLRKLNNACQGPRVYKPQMCRSASDEVQMAFQVSWPKISIPKPTQAPHDRNQSQQKQQQQTTKSTTTTTTTTTKSLTQKQQPKPQQPAKPAKPASRSLKPSISKPVSPRKPAKTNTVRPTVAEESHATKLAQEYCWKSFQGICTYFIGWFQN